MQMPVPAPRTPDGRPVAVPPGFAALASCGAQAVLRYADRVWLGTETEVATQAAALAGQVRGLRWVWWSAAEAAPLLLDAGVVVDRCWDVAEAYRLHAGGWASGPALAWADAFAVPGEPPTRQRLGTGDDLFSEAFGTADAHLGIGHPDIGHLSAEPGETGRSGEVPGQDLPWRPDGHLRPEAVSGTWQATPARMTAWADALLAVAAAQQERAHRAGRVVEQTHLSESAAALLCVELERDGLPLDLDRAADLIETAAGPRPRDEAHARAIRAARDDAVIRLVPRADPGRLDLRNPERVKELLAAAGIVVPDTRKHALAAYRGTHPVVEAVLAWRAAERIATTYGYRWLDEHVGADGRLRGAWGACDGAAGRMTAQNGLHNLPTALRPAVRAEPGHVFVRADLGQIEPRVLAAVSGDAAFAAATQADDLYAPVAAALGLDRAHAKIAVLAAMYGQTSGSAGAALTRLTRAYPAAIGYLDAAYAHGLAGRPVRTYGGRRISGGVVEADHPQPVRAQAARARYVRNAVIQGAAAELFKAWAATVRHDLRPLGGRIVLCLHDELLVHVPADVADEACAVVDAALHQASARWTGGGVVRFCSATQAVTSWADASK